MNLEIKSWRTRLHEIIFESNTTAGKIFDICLLISILTSIAVVMLDSISSLHLRYERTFFILEWGFTILFTIEYLLRLICVKRPLLYVFSFLGIVDLLAIIPMYLSIFLAGAQSLLVFRALRFLRIFRIFKLTHFLSEISFLGSAIRSSAKKISIFMLVVVAIVIILGSIMYIVESNESGFTSIPESIYWAIVTITTVGYGDMTPVTPVGKLIASLIMLIGYSIIAVPTGILTTEIALMTRKEKKGSEACPGCGKEGHDDNAVYCKFCGEKL
ncbi:MAG TPA: ion transporter [Chitinophagaceae bacterium]|jgi:voltage-gated potassium channel|nr:ion transporter [Chitinophagaceae bacterium]